MADNTDASASAAAANAAKYVIRSHMFQYMLQFLYLVFMVDAISLSCLDAICSSIILVRAISLLVIFIVMIYRLFVRIISYAYLLICSTASSLIMARLVGSSPVSLP
jgi:hypothetical protein